ncbi:MAG TPA: HD domain-containing protein [Streptosporangiaceae bacterium]|nr:HD domain-containing protein [Streptosporangiaceae bacterium]
MAENGMNDTARLNAQTLIRLMRDLATAPYRIERATTVPFDQKRYENDAEHSFSLGVAALCVAPLVDRRLDLMRIGTYALVHDLAEIYAGDTPVYSDPATRAAKPKRERVAHAELHQKFGADFPWLLNYLDDYIAMRDEESKFLYALDKILPHVSVIIADYHPARPTWRAYKASEKIARQKVSAKYPGLLQVFEELCQMYAKLPHLFSTPPRKT